MPGFDFAEILHKYGEENIKKIVDVLEAHDKRASGQLIESLAYNVNLNAKDLQYSIEFLAIEYEQYIRSGRRPGAKRPPKTEIQEWMQFKGIPLQYTVPIQKAIAEKGIQPFQFIDIVFDDNNIEDLTKVVTELLQEDFAHKITTEIK